MVDFSTFNHIPLGISGSALLIYSFPNSQCKSPVGAVIEILGFAYPAFEAAFFKAFNRFFGI